jgi:PilZ domain
MSSNAEIRGPRRFPFLRNFPVSVQRASGPEQDRLLGQVVGTVNAERVIVCGLDAGALTAGDEVVVRMAVGSEVLGFRTRVLEASAAGTALFMLAIPEKVEALSLRKSERLSLFVPAEVQFSHGKSGSPDVADLALLQGMMVNLSRGGCCLSTKRPLSVEQPIRLAFTLPGGRHTYRLGARVLRHLENPRPGVFVQGVQFEKQTEQLPALADLNQWITQSLPFALPN